MSGSGMSLGEGNGSPLQYSCLENPMDGGAWRATVHGSQRVGHNWATWLTERLTQTARNKEGGLTTCSCHVAGAAAVLHDLLCRWPQLVQNPCRFHWLPPRRYLCLLTPATWVPPVLPAPLLQLPLLEPGAHRGSQPKALQLCKGRPPAWPHGWAPAALWGPRAGSSGCACARPDLMPVAAPTAPHTPEGRLQLWGGTPTGPPQVAVGLARGVPWPPWLTAAGPSSPAPVWEVGPWLPAFIPLCSWHRPVAESIPRPWALLLLISFLAAGPGGRVEDPHSPWQPQWIPCSTSQGPHDRRCHWPQWPEPTSHPMSCTSGHGLTVPCSTPPPVVKCPLRKSVWNVWKEWLLSQCPDSSAWLQGSGRLREAWLHERGAVGLQQLTTGK